MIRLKDTSTLPPGGFPYEQPETGYKDFPKMISFGEMVAAVVKYRAGNNLPGADIQSVSEDLHTYNCVRLGGDPNYCSDGPVVMRQVQHTLAQKKTMLGSVVAAGAGLFAQVKHAPEAINIAGEWLGEGANPVAQTMAQARSDVCTGRLTGNPCPKNELSGWSFSMPIANRIHEWLERKNKMNLRVQGEDQLGTCAGCTCNLPLKVWVPFHNIHKHTPDATFQKLDPRCWMLKERDKESHVT
jgi:hypothetical protein